MHPPAFTHMHVQNVAHVILINTMTSASTARRTVHLAATFHERVHALDASGSTVVHFHFHHSVFVQHQSSGLGSVSWGHMDWSHTWPP